MRFLSFRLKRLPGRCEVLISPPSIRPKNFSEKKQFVERPNIRQIMSYGSGKWWPNLSKKKGTFLLQIFRSEARYRPSLQNYGECSICWDPKTAWTQCFRCLSADFCFFLLKPILVPKKNPMSFSCFFLFFGLRISCIPTSGLRFKGSVPAPHFPCEVAEWWCWMAATSQAFKLGTRDVWYVWIRKP